MTTPAPQPRALPDVLKMGDPYERLVALTQWRARAKEMGKTANAALLDAVRELRAQTPPATWRSLAAATGLSEQYLREMTKDVASP